jgi:hypothetical protein
MHNSRLVALAPLIFFLASSVRADKPPAKKSGATAKSAGDAVADKQLEDELSEIQKGLEQSKTNLMKSHERLAEVKNTPVNQPPQGHAKLAIVYRNQMSPLFIPTKYDVAVDGFNVYSKPDPGTGQKEIEFYRGALPPGQHQVTVSIVMKGNGYGAFSYLKDYKFIAHAGHVFSTADEKLTQVKILSIEKAGTAPKDRPAIDFQDTTWNVNVPSPSDNQ